MGGQETPFRFEDVEGQIVIEPYGGSGGQPAADPQGRRSGDRALWGVRRADSLAERRDVQQVIEPYGGSGELLVVEVLDGLERDRALWGVRSPSTSTGKWRIRAGDRALWGVRRTASRPCRSARAA